MRYFEVTNKVDVQQVIADGFEKQAIRDELNKRRQQAIKVLKESFKNSI